FSLGGVDSVNLLAENSDGNILKAVKL
ncbi:hypothetical protein EVA_10631, partial [gut metagenome]